MDPKKIIVSNARKYSVLSVFLGMVVSIYLEMAWLLVGFLTFGPSAFLFWYMRASSRRQWTTKIDSNYKPKLSILVPTYNEESVILLKLKNLNRVEYPRDLMEIIIVDSNSSDKTVEVARRFLSNTPKVKAKIVVERARKGKSHALNWALNFCEGDVIIVSDVDCFWPSDILEKAIPFLSDPRVGAISGPKILLNSNETWVTKVEEKYLQTANVLRLGESKSGSTLFFEGGFSAFKKEVLERFDPYNTGSDDCGTLISVIEKNFRAILVPEAEFYSAFPTSFRGKVGIKSRRANQLVRVFRKYLSLIVLRKLDLTKKTIVPNIMLYLFSPITFVAFMTLTVVLIFNFPFLLLALMLLVVPTFRFYFYELVESNFLLVASIVGVSLGKKFSIWNQPEDRTCITKETLRRFNLI